MLRAFQKKSAKKKSKKTVPGPSGMLRVCTLRTASRPLALGLPTWITRSNRPGRQSASSSTSRRFVAATHTTPLPPCVVAQMHPKEPYISAKEPYILPFLSHKIALYYIICMLLYCLMKNGIYIHPYLYVYI